MSRMCTNSVYEFTKALSDKTLCSVELHLYHEKGEYSIFMNGDTGGRLSSREEFEKNRATFELCIDALDFAKEQLS